MNCQLCGRRLVFAWTDSHGVAQCTECGAPYRLLHYEGEGAERKKMEREPELLLREDNLSKAQDCFRDTGARLSAVGLHLSFPGGYDVATDEDRRKVTEWWKAKGAAAQPEEESR